MAEFNVKPFFLFGQAGKLFVIYYSPIAKTNLTKAFIHIPAFAEEMNKSRRMVALQARELAKYGHAVMLIDLFGTGDSEGDFSDANWAIWKNDLNEACYWLTRQGFKSINLWGLRSGVLLAIDLLSNINCKVDKMVCWQPVLNGETFVMQFLRLRIATEIMNNKMPDEKVSDLQRRLLEGEPIEVAGYKLNPNLVNPLMSLKVSKMPLENTLEWYIYEIVNNKKKVMSSVNLKFIDILQKSGVLLVIKTIEGSPFWSTQEITEVPELLSTVTDFIS